MLRKKAWLFLIGMVLMLTACGSGTAAQPAEEVRQEVREGDFIYRLVADRSAYSTDEAVRLHAELEYVGAEEKIVIAHAASPFSFVMTEKTRNYKIDYAMDQPLITTTLKKGEPLRGEYSGSGAYGETDSEEYKQFMKSLMDEDPVFPNGEYAVNGIGTFSAGPNTEKEKRYKLESQVEFKVH